MLTPIICPELCLSCDPCQARSACKTRAIVRIDPEDVPFIALERCSRCAACVMECAGGAIMMSSMGMDFNRRCSERRLSLQTEAKKP